jgi:hypothetical protein
VLHLALEGEGEDALGPVFGATAWIIEQS